MKELHPFTSYCYFDYTFEYFNKWVEVYNKEESEFWESIND